MTLAAARSLRNDGKHEEARALLVELAGEDPSDAVLQYETACVHDALGYEAKAVPYYVGAIAGGLSPERLRGAYLGLGSTYRTLGRYAEAEATLKAGIEAFPEANEMKVFLAMVEHNLGNSTRAVEALLGVLARTSSDEGIRGYARAIEFYAKDIDRVWSQ